MGEKQMIDQPLVVRAVSAARRHIPTITLVACVSSLSVLGTMAQAKQQCSAASGSGSYWSWRLIDGRKCWYQGKPMLSKSLLEWPAQAAARPDSDRELAEAPAERRRSSVPTERQATAPAEKRHDPLDAQAQAPEDTGTFEALWRDRIE